MQSREHLLWRVCGGAFIAKTKCLGTKCSLKSPSFVIYFVLVRHSNFADCHRSSKKTVHSYVLLRKLSKSTCRLWRTISMVCTGGLMVVHLSFAQVRSIFSLVYWKIAWLQECFWTRNFLTNLLCDWKLQKVRRQSSRLKPICMRVTDNVI